MKSYNIYEEWASSIDLLKTRVIRFPSLIFLCGGPVLGGHESFESCRDIFHRYVASNGIAFREKIILAEEVFRYFDHSAYQDLLRFERDLAELSALTVIFSESPGSIAELGSFAVLKTIRDRLLVVVHESDAHKESFIWRGPSLHLKELAKEKGKDDPITVYNWRRRSRDEDLLKEHDFSDAEDLAEIIQAILLKIPKTQSFSKDQLGHIMLLMLDLLKVLQLATLDEIVNCLGFLDINHERRTVEQHVSLLRSLGFASRKPYRNNIYYLSTDHQPWISWGFAKTAKVRDVGRWKAMFFEYYHRTQKQKSRALESHLRSTGQIGE